MEQHSLFGKSGSNRSSAADLPSVRIVRFGSGDYLVRFGDAGKISVLAKVVDDGAKTSTFSGRELFGLSGGFAIGGVRFEKLSEVAKGRLERECGRNDFFHRLASFED